MQQTTLTYAARPRRRLVAGLAISILLHILLLAAWRPSTSPPAPPAAQRWSQPLTIRLLPPPLPKPKPEPITRAEAQSKPVKPDRPATRAARSSPPERMAQEREPAGTTPPAMTMVPPQPAESAPAGSTPSFDRDAARAAARGMANDLNPSANWAAEKLNKGKEWKETKEERLGRNVGNSARGDCRSAYAGAGLLAPLVMLMDKKDSGCKW